MSDGGEANNEIYMSRLCFIIVFTNRNILLNMWYISRCFKVDFSTEIIHHAFGILKIFSRGWLDSSEAGKNNFIDAY